jgi:hypothetical protein
MAEYPAAPVPAYPLKITQVWNTLRSDFDGANRQARQKQAFAKHDVVLNYKPLTKAEIQLLWSFYTKRGGAFEEFYFYTLPETEVWEDLYVGVGDGAETTFDLPGKNTSLQSIYANAVAVDSGDYTILTGGGEVSSDRVQFDTAPAEGVVISCGFTGYMRIHCCFKEDKMSKDLFEVVLYATGLGLEGVFP